MFGTHDNHCYLEMCIYKNNNMNNICNAEQLCLICCISVPGSLLSLMLKEMMHILTATYIKSYSFLFICRNIKYRYLDVFLCFLVRTNSINCGRYHV